MADGIITTIINQIITFIFVIIIIGVMYLLYSIVKYSIGIMTSKFYGLQDSWEVDPSRNYSSPTRMNDSVTAIPLRWRA